MRPDETRAAEIWRRTLTQIPSLFGRLVYLASLRDINNGRYQHFGFAQQVGDKEAERTIRRSHTNTFLDWLCLGLPEQRESLERHLESAEGEREQILAHWQQAPPYLAWIPADVLPEQRELFAMDLGLIVEMIRKENSAVLPSRGALQRR